MSVNIKVPICDYPQSQMGQRGADWIDNTAARTGDWIILYALTDVVFATLTPDDNTQFVVNGTPGNLNGKTLPAGLQLFGRFTAITLTSGTLVAYKV